MKNPPPILVHPEAPTPKAPRTIETPGTAVYVFSAPLNAGTPASALVPSDVKTKAEPAKRPWSEGVVSVDKAVVSVVSHQLNAAPVLPAGTVSDRSVVQRGDVLNVNVVGEVVVTLHV